MKEFDKDILRLYHIRDAIAFVAEYSAGLQSSDLTSDLKLRFSIERQLEIIGEAANHISTETKTLYPHIQWPQIVSFRNFLAHEYFGIDLELIWGIVQNHIPDLREQIDLMILDLENKKK